MKVAKLNLENHCLKLPLLLLQTLNIYQNITNKTTFICISPEEEECGASGLCFLFLITGLVKICVISKIKGKKCNKRHKMISVISKKTDCEKRKQ